MSDDPLGLLCELEGVLVWEQSKLESWQRMRKETEMTSWVCVWGGVGGW